MRHRYLGHNKSINHRKFNQLSNYHSQSILRHNRSSRSLVRPQCNLANSTVRSNFAKSAVQDENNIPFDSVKSHATLTPQNTPRILPLHAEIRSQKDLTFQRASSSSALGYNFMNDNPFSPEQIASFDAQLDAIHQSSTLAPRYHDKLTAQATSMWDSFYKKHASSFFKDRQYLHREFPALEAVSMRYEQDMQRFQSQLESTSFNSTLLPSQINETLPISPLRPVFAEIGCGTGNSLFPILESFPHLSAIVCDCSEHAIQCLQAHPIFQQDPTRISTAVSNIGQETIPFQSQYVDVMTLVYVLSALHPEKEIPHAVSECFRLLKPGGSLYIRDYAEYDLTMFQFQRGQRLSNEMPWFVRGDATRTFYFSKNTLIQYLTQAGFQVKPDDVKYITKTVTNVKQQQEMHRCWITAVVTRPLQ